MSDQASLKAITARVAGLRQAMEAVLMNSISFGRRYGCARSLQGVWSPNVNMVSSAKRREEIVRFILYVRSIA